MSKVTASFEINDTEIQKTLQKEYESLFRKELNSRLSEFFNNGNHFQSKKGAGFLMIAESIDKFIEEVWTSENLQERMLANAKKTFLKQFDDQCEIALDRAIKKKVFNDPEMFIGIPKIIS